MRCCTLVLGPEYTTRAHRHIRLEGQIEAAARAAIAAVEGERAARTAALAELRHAAVSELGAQLALLRQELMGVIID